MGWNWIHPCDMITVWCRGQGFCVKLAAVRLALIWSHIFSLTWWYYFVNLFLSLSHPSSVRDGSIKKNQ